MLNAIVNKMMNVLSKISVEKEDVVGVDITPNNIRVAQLDNQKNRWILSKLGYRYIDGVNDQQSIKNRPVDYVQKLKEIIRTSKIKTLNAAISIPVSSAIIKVINIPLMTDEELQEAIDTDSLWENVIQLSEALDEYSIFWQIIKRHTEENTMDLLFVASKLSDIDTYINIVEQSGLNPVVVDVRCFSLRNALSLKKDLGVSSEPIVLFEFGPYENYLLILKDDAPFITDIYVSDQDRTHILDSAQDPDACQKIFDRYAMQVTQVLASYQSKYRTQPIKNILVSSVLPVIDQHIECLKRALPDIQFSQFDMMSGVTVPENLKKKVSAELNSTVFSSVLGLSTRKLDIFGYYKYVTGTNNINLLPDRDNMRNVEKTKFLSKIGISIVAIIIISAGIWSFIDNQEDVAEVDQRIQEYHDLNMQRNEKKMELSELQKQQREIESTLETTKGIRSNQSFMYSVLSSINQSIPHGIALSSINYEGGKLLTLKGSSVNDQNILTLINRLNNTDHVHRASLMTMTAKTEEGKKQAIKIFSVRCTLSTVVKSEVGDNT